ncbi:MAG TPA: CvpA family protein [Nitrolancea sp.]
MNTLDICIMVVFLGTFTLAFFAGIGRSAAGLIALVIATVAAAIFYKAVGTIMTHLFIPIDPVIAQLAAFLLLLLVAGVGIDYILLRSFRLSRLRTRLALELSGGVPGIIALALLSVVLAGLLVAVLTQVSDSTVRDLPDGWGTEWLNNEFDDSPLAEQTLKLSPYIYRPVNIITPGFAPSILAPRASTLIEPRFSSTA